MDTYEEAGYSPRVDHQYADHSCLVVWGCLVSKKRKEYGILTDEVTKAESATRQNLQGLKAKNLRDNMSVIELALNISRVSGWETNAQNPRGLKKTC